MNPKLIERDRLIHATTWLNLENIMLSGIRQDKECILYDSTYMSCLNMQI